MNDRTAQIARNGRANASSPSTAPSNNESFHGESRSERLDTGTRTAVIVLAIIAVVWFLSWASPIIVPVVAAILIGMVLGPIADRTKRFGVPGFVTNTAVLVLLALAAYGVAGYFIPTIAEWIDQAPSHLEEVKQKFAVVRSVVSRIQDFQKLLSGAQPAAQIVDQPAGVTTVIAAVSPAFAQFFVFVGTLVFFLISRNAIKSRLVLACRGRERRLTALRIAADIETRLLDHFAVISVINLGVGVATMAMLMALGFPRPAVWGFLAFVVNYLPVIGPIGLKIALFGTGILLMPTLTMAVVPVAGYLLITTIESNIITPNIVARRITVDPLVVFVTICFLTWLWGAVGALLSMPLINVVSIASEHLWSRDEVELPG